MITTSMNHTQLQLRGSYSTLDHPPSIHSHLPLPPTFFCRISVVFGFCSGVFFSQTVGRSVPFCWRVAGGGRPVIRGKFSEIGGRGWLQVIKNFIRIQIQTSTKTAKAAVAVLAGAATEADDGEEVATIATASSTRACARGTSWLQWGIGAGVPRHLSATGTEQRLALHAAPSRGRRDCTRGSKARIVFLRVQDGNWLVSHQCLLLLFHGVGALMPARVDFIAIVLHLKFGLCSLANALGVRHDRLHVLEFVFVCVCVCL